MEKLKLRKTAYLRGIITGVASTLVVLLLVVFTALQVGIMDVSVGKVKQTKDETVQTSDSNGIGDEVASKLDKMQTVLQQFYFEAPSESLSKELIYKAYALSFKDKYTTYYTAEEYEAQMTAIEGNSIGIGVQITLTDDYKLHVNSVLDNSPAKEAGLLDGDEIIMANGEKFDGLDLTAAADKIRGPEGTSVEITVLRGSQQLNFTVTRRKFETQVVKSQMLDGDIGYIKVTEFDEVASAQFADQYKSLQDQGMTGLVIDLRNNPGGVLTTATTMLDGLLPDGKIVTIESKSGNSYSISGNDPAQISVPLAVIVNGNSASASEVFAGAVKDYGVGTIVGTQTYGKGIVQTVVPLGDGSALKFTNAKYLTPNGVDIHEVGLTPDVVVEGDEAQLNAAIAAVKAAR